MSAEALLVVFSTILFHVGFVLASFTHSLWFALIAYVWWTSVALVAEFRSVGIDAVDSLVLTPLTALIGAVVALALIWWSGTTSFPMIPIDVWKINMRQQDKAKPQIVRQAHWPMLAFVFGTLGLVVAFNFLRADFSPDLIATTRVSVLIGISLLVISLAAIILSLATLYKAITPDFITPRLHIFYAILCAVWALLPTAIYRSLGVSHNGARLTRFVIVEIVLIALTVVSTLSEQYMMQTPPGEQYDDLRHVTSTRTPRNRQILRWAVGFWLPLTFLYIFAAIADSVDRFVFALGGAAALLLVAVAIFSSRSGARSSAAAPPPPKSGDRSLLPIRAPAPSKSARDEQKRKDGSHREDTNRPQTTQAALELDAFGIS